MFIAANNEERCCWPWPKLCSRWQPLVLRVLLFSFSIFQRARPEAARAATLCSVMGHSDRMLLAVAEVMFEMAALGLEGVVVFVLDLPAGAAGSRQGRHVVLGDGPVGDPGIEVKHLPLRVGHGDFTPVDFQGVLTFGQGDLVGPAISVSVPLTA